jgi:hypothetical protein
MNANGARFCHVCGRILSEPIKPIAKPAFVVACQPAPADDPYAEMPPTPGETTENRQATFLPVPEKHESLLERLDRMEHELESRKGETPPETGEGGHEHLDEQEEALKNIAYTLDTLITDLLEAEAREYAFPEFIHPDETGFPLKTASAMVESDEKKRRSLAQVLLMAALVVAIFLVGTTFGLWVWYFFGFQ